MRNIAVILAGGTGKRVGKNIPKQFIAVMGKPIIAYALSAFDNHPLIDEIIVVVHKDYIEETGNIVREEGFKKVCRIVSGGKERYESTCAALEVYGKEECNLIIHDAARPFPTKSIIDSVISHLKTHKAVNTAIDSTDSLIKSDSAHGTMREIVDRNIVMRVQTPQGFYAPLLKKAYEIGMRNPDFKTTDDCSVVHEYLPEETIAVVKGDPMNIKVTTPYDLLLVEFILSRGSVDFCGDNR